MMREKKIQGMAVMTAMLVLTVHSAFAEEKLKDHAASRKQDKAVLVRRIVISIPDRKLALLQDGAVVKIWHTAVGTESTPTPSGTYTIVNRVSSPSYYQPGKVIAAGPSNPVGTRWLGLSLKGFGIHGTNRPGSIGKKASHGCIRMRNRDVEELFDLVRIGDVVELHRERDERLADIFHSRRPSAPVPGGTTPPVVTVASAR